MIFPFFAFMFNGFSIVRNRWCFGLAFFICLIITWILPEFSTLTQKDYTILFVGILLYTFIALGSNIKGVFKDFNNVGQDSFGSVTIYVTVIILLLTFIMILFKLNKTILMNSILLITAFTLIINFNFNRVAVMGTFADAGKAMDVVMRDAFFPEVKNGNEVRYDQFYPHHDSTNAPLLSDYNGTSEFASIMNPNLLEFFCETENAGLRNTILLYDLDGRTFIEALASIKYFTAAPKDKTYVPYGFTEEQISNKGLVYLNQYALPLGYTYNKYILREDYKELSALQKQEAMLQAVVLDESLPNYPQEDNLKFSAVKITPTIEKCKDVSWKNGKVKISKKNATMQLSFKGEP